MRGLAERGTLYLFEERVCITNVVAVVDVVDGILGRAVRSRAHTALPGEEGTFFWRDP